jgi:predicted XRE-type DNA-binding protein
MNASADMATIQALRSDLALQLARHIGRMRVPQVVAAKRLGLPQPTLSKIINGRIADMSIELLIRIAVRADLPMALQTGRVPEEAGVFSARTLPRAVVSKVAETTHQQLVEAESRLTPSQRLEAFLEHNQWVAALHEAGGAAEARRLREATVR